ncbi:transcription initiation factor TFIID subunit 8 [Coemansia sp. RSA 353]|nr:transcription initiation factor TFIID subunit 8 [Coemansia sp. RSA 518]KAJ2276984.1 transcription initiation factor TFIID subunit 8 [Coemansia sp. RSA 371]KAJ2300089.1 transcription initiation factor TFIID subunit 8 [Coemansia sp. RSA 353]KAJ2552996.1 transcription initiation factor TFIID subunit 8 [Coemansia sp. RSA 1878]
MSSSESDAIRQQYMRRALSILLRGTNYDTATASSLDVLSTVGALYMQTMFAHVHAYAEHATRTRPNMNDVGRALDERRVSVGQLDSYRRTEAQIRSQPAVEAAVLRLHEQAEKWTSADSSSMGAFVDTRAEDLLQKLIGFHSAQVERTSVVHEVPATSVETEPVRTAASKVSSRGFDEEDDDDDEDDDFEAPELNSMHLPLAADSEPMADSGAEADDTHPHGSDTVDNVPVPAPVKAAPKIQDEISTMLKRPTTLPPHVPAQCPQFPSPHTYKQTPVYPEREQDFFRTRMHKAEQSRQAEENLQRLISGPHSKDALEDTTRCAPDAKDRAQRRVRAMFPPVNFRDLHKRSRLDQWRLQTQQTQSPL